MGTDTAEAPVAASRSGKSQAAFRTISEVADELDVAQHVLRFWESKFPQVRPLKRGGGRRYYRPEDIDLLRDIRTLLYDEGYTIKGAQKLLRQRRARPQAAPAAKVPAPSPPAPKAALPAGDAENGLLQHRLDATPAIPAALGDAVLAAPELEPLAAIEEPMTVSLPAAAETELERLRRLRAALHEVRHDLAALLAADPD